MENNKCGFFQCNLIDAMYCHFFHYLQTILYGFGGKMIRMHSELIVYFHYYFEMHYLFMCGVWLNKEYATTTNHTNITQHHIYGLE